MIDIISSLFAAVIVAGLAAVIVLVFCLIIVLIKITKDFWKED